MKIFSLERVCSRSFEAIFFSAANTTPFEARTPRQVPAWLIASMAYSTWYKRPILLLFQHFYLFEKYWKI